jgi:hypothetical protein
LRPLRITIDHSKEHGLQGESDGCCGAEWRRYAQISVAIWAIRKRGLARRPLWQARALLLFPNDAAFHFNYLP